MRKQQIYVVRLVFKHLFSTKATLKRSMTWGLTVLKLQKMYTLALVPVENKARNLTCWFLCDKQTPFCTRVLDMSSLKVVVGMRGNSSRVS